MRDTRQSGGIDLLPLLVLAGLIGLALVGWWLFPVVARLISSQDCVALGRTTCS